MRVRKRRGERVGGDGGRRERGRGTGGVERGREGRRREREREGLREG